MHRPDEYADITERCAAARARFGGTTYCYVEFLPDGTMLGTEMRTKVADLPMEDGTVYRDVNVLDHDASTVRHIATDGTVLRESSAREAQAWTISVIRAAKAAAPGQLDLFAGADQ